MLHEETVEKRTLALIKDLSADHTLKDFVLVGGTALSLQLGHRKSLDIDLFTPKDFDSKSLAEYLKDRYYAERVGLLKNAVFSYINGIKVDMISHQYGWVKEAEDQENIRMASLDDIAAMKLNAIVGNGSRLKDYVDMHALLEYRSLEQMTQAYVTKYPEMNGAMARNALLYHHDIKFDVEVNLMKGKLNWPDIADRLRQSVMEPKRVFDLKTKLSTDLEQDQRSEVRKRLKKGRGR